MRLIRTDILFAPREVKKISNPGALRNPGISFVFLNSRRNFFYETDRRGFELGDIIFQRSLHLGEGYPRSFLADEFLQVFIDTALRGGSFASLIDERSSRNGELQLRMNLRPSKENHDVVTKILEDNIVFEQSPPDWIPVNQILKWGPVVGGGTALGIFGSSQPLLLITVPAGIIIMGSAIGVAKAFERGLPRVIDEKLLKRRR